MEEIRKQKLHLPTLDELSAVLLSGLQTLFSFVIVSVIDCPNLKQKPFMLASEGLGGSPALVQVGGHSYLFPEANLDKVYNLKEIAQEIDMPNALMIGAGSGPRNEVGVLSELMANVKLGKNALNNTHIAKLGPKRECQLIHLKNSTGFCFMGHFFVSGGRPSKVIHVIAKNRIAPGNLVTNMRKALTEHYKNKTVGIGGVFVIKRGKVKIHVMPNYPKDPHNPDEDPNHWFKFFHMPTPLSCLSTIISYDPGLDLEMEHSHCFSDHGHGGHYHEDITPIGVEYEGYFNVAEEIYRLDTPTG